MDLLATEFKAVLPEEWRRNVPVLIFSNKGDVQSCSNYRGMTLMSHTVKI